MPTNTRLIDITMSADTSIFAAGDVIADTQQLAASIRTKNFGAILDTLVLVDEDDQGAAMTVIFFGANVSLGTENAAPSITDANARSYLGKVVVGTADWVDLGGVRVASFHNLGIVLKPETDTQNIYVAVLNGAGTPTFTAAGLKLRIGIID